MLEVPHCDSSDAMCYMLRSAWVAASWPFERYGDASGEVGEFSWEVWRCHAKTSARLIALP